MGYIDPQDLVPPIQIQSVYWGLERMERPIHTKFDTYAYIPTLNNATKNYRHRCTGFGTSHISQIGKLGS